MALEEVNLAATDEQYTVLVHGDTGVGKCVTGDTRILSPDGRYSRIEDIVKWGKYSTLSVNENGEGPIRESTPSAYLNMGISRIYQMSLMDGRVLRGTPEHPVLTTEGYVPLSRLTEDHAVVVCDELPFFGKDIPRSWEPALLAFIIANGNLSQGNPIFTTGNEDLMERFTKLVRETGDDVTLQLSADRTPQALVTGGGLKEWLIEEGLWGRKSKTKIIPDKVYTWNKDSLKTFLSGLFTCDGTLNVTPIKGRNYPTIDLGYSSSSFSLISGVAHLLRRFSFHPRHRAVKGTLNGVEHGGNTLAIARMAEISRFVKEIGIERPNAKEIAEQAEYRAVHNAEYANRGGNDSLGNGLRCERIRSIQDAGEAQVYDLTIPGNHNFLANDIIVHNTYFASSWPSTLFLSVNDEKGWETIRWMDKSNFYDGQAPRIWKLKKATDIIEAHKDVQPLIASGKVKTIVIDSLTFWVEMFYDHLLSQSATKDNRQVYGVLGDHLRNIRIKFHQLPCNIIWLCTTRQPDETGKLAMPEIKGKSALTFPAGCKYVWYMRSAQEGKATTFLLHTRKYANVMARGRDGGRLPDPITNPSYLKIHQALLGIAPTEFVDKPEEELIAEAEKAVDENQALMDPVLTLSDPSDSVLFTKQVAPVIAPAPAKSTSAPVGLKPSPLPPRRPVLGRP